MSTQPTQRRRAGFTLIEVLMASAAAALILAAVYGVFGRAMRLRDDATERTRVGRLRSRAATVIRNDLRSALISGGKIAATLQGSREGRASRFPGYLKFTASNARDGISAQPSADVQQVEYYVADDPDGAGRDAGILVRAVDRNLLAETRDVPPEEPLLTGVAALEVSFYDGQTWTDSWEVTEDALTLPQAIRVRVLQATPADNVTAPLPIEIFEPWLTEAATLSTQTTVPAGPPTPGAGSGGTAPGGSPP